MKRVPLYNNREVTITRRHRFRIISMIRSCLAQGETMEWSKEKTGKKPNTAQHESLDTINISKVSARYYKDLFNNASDAILIRDLNGNINEANKAAVTLTGYARNELIGTNVSELLNAKSFKAIMKKQKALLEGETANQCYELEIIRKDRSRINAGWRTDLLTHKGRLLGVQCIVRDLTEQRRMEKELWVAEQNFRNSLDSSPLGIRIVTAEGKLLYANQAILDIYGYSSVEELKSVPIKQRYTPRSYAEHQIRKDERKQGKPEPPTYEISIIRKDGEVRHLEVCRKVVIWEGKIQFQILHWDITEHKRVEMALRQSEEFNSSLLTNSPNPILVLNADASIRYVNPALEKLTDFSAAELIGKNPPYPWWIEETHKELSHRLRQAIRYGTRKYESLLRKKNGERFWVEKILKPVNVNGALEYFLVNWVDLTEQKRLKVNMEFYLSEITKAQEEERKRIACEIHDESIQSLAALALDIDAIASGKERLPGDVILRLKGLRAKVNSILDGLRRFSHDLRPGVIDQVGLVPALEILIEEANKNNIVKNSLEVSGSERRLATNTEVALFRIVQEALRNIKRHSGAIQSVTRLRFTRTRVRITVSDNGRGFEVPDTLSDFASESKLGLIGMQERTRLLGGKLLVKSRVGRGTTIIVEIADIQGMKE
jgi:two-component system sensor histidine kinase DegS